MAACMKKPEQTALRTLVKFLPAETMSSLYLLRVRARVRARVGARVRVRARVARVRVGARVRAGGAVELVPVHDSEQLLAHVLRAPHRARLDEVLEAPRVGELGVGPRLVDGEAGEVVALRLEELGALRVGLGLLLLGAVEDVLHVEHGHEGEDLVGAAEVDALDEHLGERRLHRELGHPPAEAREQTWSGLGLG